LHIKDRRRMKVLILGGSSEATQLGRRLAGDPRFQAVISLAGRTLHPAPQPLPTRIGGFGGVTGLAQYLIAEKFDALIDATHPFAVRISRNAVEACDGAGVPMLALQRPEWRPVAGDHWITVADMPAAARALGERPRHVLLTIGQKDLAPFAAAPQHRYLVRSVDPPPPHILPASTEVIAMRGPFLESDERKLLAERGIEILVTKNAGGSATAAKLSATRALGLPVVMIARPAPPQAKTVASVAEALDWLLQRHSARSERGA
jgi:precorrin-6A/cobalt-precorrin-6A reductase